MIERKDLGIRIGAQKAQLADEVLTRSQIIPGNNISFEYMANWDIKIHALQSNAGGTGIRDLFCIVALTRLPQENAGKTHYDIQTELSPAQKKNFMGTHVFADIKHNWNLPNPDMFQYSLIDARGLTQASETSTDSIPTVIGIDSDTIRIIATDPIVDTRIDPTLWVDTVGGDMQNTKFINFSDPIYENFFPELTQLQATPMYYLRVTEVVDVNPARVSENPIKIA